AEPPPRAMYGGLARKQGETPIEPRILVYDRKTQRYVLFGGDHLDYLTNDTWLFDPEQKRWMQQHPSGAPPPRGNHRLETRGDGTIVMSGGYTYANNTDYLGGQYVDLDDGLWTYDITTSTWSGGVLVPSDSRVYRSGPFHPAFYLQGDPPDPKAFAAWLENIPANEWVATRPPYRPRLNRRPWMTGHTYQNYAYDPPTKTMVKAGRPKHFYVYDPDEADWVGRGVKPEAMQYNSCFYTLTLAATPEGAVCWDKHGKVHRYDGKTATWRPIELSGDPLPGAVVDNSSVAYDSKRSRLLMIVKPYGKAPFLGQVHSLDLKTGRVTMLTPTRAELGARFAYIDRCCYDPENDLLLLASYLTEAGEVTPTPAYDCAANAWVLLDLNYQTGQRGRRLSRAFPHGRSCGLVYDRKRHLFWGTDTNSEIYVLRLLAPSTVPQ
ncbi:MAG: hypothetical protein AAF492_06075, partial [Verrucomicrobiota bacterium]